MGQNSSADWAGMSHDYNVCVLIIIELMTINIGLFINNLHFLIFQTVTDAVCMVYVEFGADISATFTSAKTTRRRQSQRLFKSAPSNTALTHFGDLHFSEHNSPLPNTAPIEIV